MSFAKVKNLRIKSLLPGAVVELRLGKAAVKTKLDVTVSAKLIRHYDNGDKLMAEFELTEPDKDGNTELTLSRFPGAPWRSGSLYASLVGVDQSTFTIQKATSPISTEVIGKAIELVVKEREDIFGADQLIALLNEIKGGRRVNTNIKALANQLATKLVEELESLPDNPPAGVPGE